MLRNVLEVGTVASNPRTLWALSRDRAQKSITATQTFPTKTAAKQWASRAEVDIDRGEYLANQAKLSPSSN